MSEDRNLFCIFNIEYAPFLFSSINLRTLLGLRSKTESSLAAKKAGNIRKRNKKIIFMHYPIGDGGGEDRTRLRRIMSSLHSPDCYTPKKAELNFFLIIVN